MRKLHPLTPEQQTFAEEHHDFIYTYLRCRRLSVQDFYDSAVFGYLEAVQEYLEKPHLQEYCFEAVATVAMRSAIAEEFKSQYRQRQTALLKEDLHASLSLDEFLPERQQYIAEAMDNRNYLVHLFACMTPKEKEVVHLKADGLTYREIADQCNITKHGVNSRFYRLRQRLRKMELEECL